MSGLTRQQTLLLFLLVAAVVAGIVQWRSTSATGVAGTPAADGARGGSARGSPVADLQLERLKPAAPAASEPTRNPFRFQQRVASSSPGVSGGGPLPAPAAPAAPAGPPGPPPIPLKFIGLLDAPQRIGRVAILSDTRGSVFYGKEGDIIDGRYQVVSIGAESAELAYADGRGRQTLRLSGQ